MEFEVDAIDDDRGRLLGQVCIAMIVLPPIVVGLRFWSRAVTLGRQHTGSVFWWDDWLALANLPFTIAQSAMTLRAVHLGLGKHKSQLPLTNILKIFFWIYLECPLYDVSITLSKLSAIFFYARVFRAKSGWFRVFLWGTAGMAIAWMFFTVPVSIFTCNPIQRGWDPRVKGTCLPYYPWWMACSLSSAFVNLAILLLPMPLVWRLQLKLTRKIFIICAFVCAYSVIGITIGYVITLRRYGEAVKGDLTYHIVPIMYWATVESPLCTINICLPSLFNLAKRVIEDGPSSLLSSRTNHSVHSGHDLSRTGRGNIRHGDEDGYMRFEVENAKMNLKLGDNSQDYHATVSKAAATSGEALSMQAIRVRKEVEVTVKEAHR